MVWYGMVWYGMVWYGMVWYGMVWYGMVWYGMVDVCGGLLAAEEPVLVHDRGLATHPFHPPLACPVYRYPLLTKQASMH